MRHILTLIENIQNKKARIGLIGVGYVGEAIGRATAERGYEVHGYARKSSSVERINSQGIENFTASTDITSVASCDVVCVCVPTPVHPDKTPDLTPLKDALSKVVEFLHKGQLVVIESSVAPGTTRGVALPILERSGYLVEEDFFLAFSPERIDPGNPEYQFSNIPKVVSGIGDRSSLLAYAFYSHIVDSVHLVSSVEAAEMSKILENTFRLVNISLIQEISEYTKKINVDIHEVVQAAATKPFGFLPHFPGPGIGGHCIPVDPYYLLQDAREKDVEIELVARAGEINLRQPEKVVEVAHSIIHKTNGKKKNHSVLLLGVAYKADISDTRESAAGEIWDLLTRDGVSVSYFDPFVARYRGKQSIVMDESRLQSFDLIIIVANHRDVDYRMIAASGVPVLDTRRVYTDFSASNIYDLFYDGKEVNAQPSQERRSDVLYKV